MDHKEILTKAYPDMREGDMCLVVDTVAKMELNQSEVSEAFIAKSVLFMGSVVYAIRQEELAEMDSEVESPGYFKKLGDNILEA